MCQRHWICFLVYMRFFLSRYCCALVLSRYYCTLGNTGCQQRKLEQPARVDGFQRGDQGCQVRVVAIVFLFLPDVGMSLALACGHLADADVHGACCCQVACAARKIIVGGAYVGRGRNWAGTGRVGARRVFVGIPCGGTCGAELHDEGVDLPVSFKCHAACMMTSIILAACHWSASTNSPLTCLRTDHQV